MTSHLENEMETEYEFIAWYLEDNTEHNLWYYQHHYMTENIAIFFKTLLQAYTFFYFIWTTYY